MATFGAGFIGDLLKSAHQQGEGEKTIGEMKGIAQYIKNITNKLTETAEWFTGDLSTLTSVLSYLNEIKKSLAESADKNTNLGIDILTRIDVLLTTITDVVDRVKKEGSTKAIAAVEDLEESDSSAFEVFKSDPLKFFDSLPTFMSLSVKIDDMKKAIMSNMHTGFEFQSTQLRLASSKLGTLSTYLDVQNKFSGKALGDLKNMTVDAQKKQEVNGFPLKKFLKMWGSEDNPVMKLTHRIKTIGSFFKNFSKIMYTMLSGLRVVMATIWRGLLSMMIPFFAVILPQMLLILAIITLTVVLLYLVWKHFGERIKKFLAYIKEYVVDYLIMAWKNIKEVLFWVWDTVKLVWGTLTDIFDMVNAMFSGDWVGMLKIMNRFYDRITGYIVKTFEHIFNIFENFGEFLSKLPVIGPVFKFLFGVLMPFMRFFIDAFKWTYSFIKDYIATVWDSVVDMISLVKAIFSGDFRGAGVIVQSMFDRLTAFITDKVIDILIILQKLGNSLLIPIQWLGEQFQKSWNMVSGWIGDMFSWVASFWTNMISKLTETVGGVLKNIGSALNPFNWFAEGGVVSKPVKGIVGEAGPEAIIPLSGGADSKLSKALVDFFDYYLPFLKPTVDFLWKTFKPMLPILESVMDSIYGVVYGIISGLSNLPGWLGGGIFKTLLSKMSKTGLTASSSSEVRNDSGAYAKILGSNTSPKLNDVLFALVGPSMSAMSKLPTLSYQVDTIKADSAIIGRESSDTKSLDKSFKAIERGFDTLSAKIDQAVSGLAGTIVANANKAPIVDPAYEVSKMFSRGQLGGKI